MKALNSPNAPLPESAPSAARPAGTRLLGRAFRKIANVGCGVPGVRPIVRSLRSRSAAIVMYHGVVAEPLPVANWCQIGAAEFARQVEFLAQEYRILELGEVVDRLGRGAPLPERAACLTFDDGFRNVATTAFPILARHAAPATVFLVTSRVGTDQPAWPDQVFHDVMTCPEPEIRWLGRRWPLDSPERRAAAYRSVAQRLKSMEDAERVEQTAALREVLGNSTVAPDSPLASMSWEEVARLSGSGLVTFGSHTHTHPILSRCPEAKQFEELRTSRDIIKARLGRAELFAYPNGAPEDFTATTKTALRELGYRCGLSTAPGLVRPGDDLYALRRVCVGADTTDSAFERLMLGF